MNQPLKWIIDSHVWIALGAVGLSLFTLKTINEQPSINFLGLILIATFFIYNLQSLLKWKRRYKDSAKRSVVGLQTTKIMTILSGILMIVLSFQLESDQVVLAGIMGLLSIFYAAKVNWSKRKKTDLRSIPFIKIYLIGIVWAGVCGLLPMLYYKTELFPNDYFFVLGIFFYILGITVPFDIRDLKYDRKSLKTLPQLFGEKGGKVVSALFMVVAAVLFTHLLRQNYLSPGLYVLSLSILGISILLTALSNSERSNYYYTGLIDGTLVLFGLSAFMV